MLGRVACYGLASHKIPLVRSVTLIKDTKGTLILARRAWRC